MGLWSFAAYALCFALTLTFIADLAETHGIKGKFAVLLLAIAWPAFWVAVLVTAIIRWWRK